MEEKKVMMNLFSLSKLFLLRVLAIVAMAIYITVSYELDIIVVMAALFMIAVNFKEQVHLYKQEKRYEQVHKFAQNMANGELEYRITNFKADSAATQDTLNHLNAAADQIETFMREVQTCFTFAQQHIYYRSPFTQGLHGAYSNTLNNINFSFNIMRQRNIEQHVSNLFSQLSESKTSNLINNLKMSHSDIEVVNNELTGVEVATQNAANSALASKLSVSKVIENTSQIVEKVSLLKNSSEELDKSSAEIADIISFIAGIADQTNLLALNAAIEAARAGEHGRGFAVVADEVRTLADNTKTATTKITNIIGRVVESSNDILEKSAQIEKSSSVSHELVTEFDKNFSEFSDVAQRTSESIAHSRMISTLTLCKLDHILFMQLAYRAIELGVDSEEAHIAQIDAKDSSFGQWLNSEDGGQSYSHLPSYAKLQDPHTAVHLYSYVMVQMLKGDWKNNIELQEQLLLNITCAEGASAELVSLLDKLVEEKKHFESTDEEDSGEIDLF